MSGVFSVLVERARKQIFVRLDAKKDSSDPRDFLFNDIIATTEQQIKDITELPETLDLRNRKLLVRNQGTQGSCAGFTASEIKEIQEDTNEYLSPQYVYNMRENQNSSGMTARDTMKILHNWGIPYERSFRYNINKNNQPSDRVHEEASNYKIKSYVRVETVEDAKKALYHFGPLYISFPVYNSGSRMWVKRPNDKYEGGHACSVVGYNSDGFILRNHWSIDWNPNSPVGAGHTLLPYDEWDLIWDVWSSIDDRSDETLNRIFPFIYKIQNKLTNMLDNFFNLGKKNNIMIVANVIAFIVAIISVTIFIISLIRFVKNKKVSK